MTDPPDKEQRRQIRERTEGHGKQIMRKGE